MPRFACIVAHEHEPTGDSTETCVQLPLQPAVPTHTLRSSRPASMHRAIAALLTHAVPLDPVHLASSDHLRTLAAAQTYFDFNAVFMLIHCFHVDKAWIQQLNRVNLVFKLRMTSGNAGYHPLYYNLDVLERNLELVSAHTSKIIRQEAPNRQLSIDKLKMHKVELGSLDRDAYPLHQIQFTLKHNGLIKTQAFIDGKWVDANDGEVFKVTNTSTGEALGTAPDLGCAETINAINATERAFGTWSKTTAKNISKYCHDTLLKLAQLIYANTEDLGCIITLEHGKTLSDGRERPATWPRSSSDSVSIVSTQIKELPWHSYSTSAEEGVRAYGEVIQTTSFNIRNVVIKQPVGVVGAVTPSNFPAAMVTRKLGPALAAGCTVVLKPSSSTPYSALVIAELACRAGVPDGVINIITTKEHVDEVGRKLCEKKTVEKITFTGSSQQSAETMKKVTLAGSGNVPFIVFNDADLNDALIGLVSATQAKRATAPVMSKYNTLFTMTLLHDLLVESPSSNTHGPLAHSRAVDKVEAVVKDAIKQGASDALYFTEENSSPVIALIKFETEDEVLRLANRLSSHSPMKDLISGMPHYSCSKSAMEGAAEPALPDSARPSSPPSSPHPGPLQAPHPLAVTTKSHPQSQPLPIDDTGPISTSILHLPGLVILSCPRCHICTPICTRTHVHTHTPVALTHPPPPPPHYACDHTPNPHALAHVLLHPPTSQEVSTATDKPLHTS
ncbi:ALDH-like protein [Ramaria rubella]|nr:ALDH-like protein [Ramaria rubella]